MGTHSDLLETMTPESGRKIKENGEVINVADVLNNVYDEVNKAIKTTATIDGDVNIDSTALDTSGYIGKSSGINRDFALAYTTAQSITLSALPVDVAAFVADDIVAVLQIATDGSVTNTYTRDDLIMTMAGNVLTLPAASFIATDSFVIYTNVNRRPDHVFDEDSAHTSADDGVHILAVRSDVLSAKTDGDGDYGSLSIDNLGYLYAVIRGYDSAADSNKTFESNPIWNQNLGETLAAETDGADGTYTYFVDMDGYSGLNLQLTLSGGSGTVTVTVEASIQDDGTAAASVTYQDVSSAVFGAVSWTATAMLLDSAKVLGGVKWVKVKVVAATGAQDDADWTIYAKKLY